MVRASCNDKGGIYHLWYLYICLFFLDGDCGQPSIERIGTAVAVLRIKNLAIATIFFLEATVHPAVVRRANVRP